MRNKNHQSLLNENYRSLFDRPDDPDVWVNRGYIVSDNFEFEDELDLIKEFAEEHPKCYLFWYYRRWIVEKIGPKAITDELKFTKEILWTKGIRNYPAWSHIQEIYKRNFDECLWLEEFQFFHEILEKDKYNVWAWDHICHAVRLPQPYMCNALRDNETIFAKKAICAQPGNDGPWIYLKILYADDKKRLYTSPDLECIYVDVLAEAAYRLKSTMELDPSYKVTKASVDSRGCIHAFNLIVDLMFLGYQADQNTRLVEAVDFLFDKYRCSFYKFPKYIQKMDSGVSRKVHSLMLNFDAFRIRFCYMNNQSTNSHTTDYLYEPCETKIEENPVSFVISSQSQERLNTILDSVITSLFQENKVFNELLSSNPALYLGWSIHLHERLCQYYLQKWKGHEIAEDDTLDNLKWVLRQFAVKKIGTRAAALAELDYTTGIIEEDAYNRHAWSHRQWVLQTFDEDWVDEDGAEIEFCRRILDEDSCNSYAWDQRYFVVTRWIPLLDTPWDDPRDLEPGPPMWEKVLKLKETVERHMNREIDYATNVIVSEPENQFPWSHIHGVYKVHPLNLHFCGPKLADVILSVLQGARDCVLGLDAHGGEGVMGSDGQVASLVNTRGVVNALNMHSRVYLKGIVDVNKDTEEKHYDVLKVLCPNSFFGKYEWDNCIDARTYAIMRHLRKDMAGHDLLWENAADQYGFN
ncbi:hypothetical protein CASFOL_007006 [Castilleja foliolosa]|uniref:Protein farnesyltransferase/geranylgeranyltransferase type-1 subunit alpha n=1 Tax=Castilleja foliolosa TaxID=1961234 RepID=A0ABD3E825_9LAMI